MNPIFAVSLAMRKSLAATITAPAPTASPLTAQTTGFRSLRMFAMSSPVIRVNATSPCMSRAKSSPMMAATSPPEQTALPSPVNTTTRISS